MKFIVAVTFSVLAASGLWGQSNEVLDDYLQRETADVATTLLLVAQAADKLPADATGEQAYAWGLDQSFGKHVARAEASDSIGLGLFYLALLKTFEVKGGMMFNSVGNPRYAAFEAGYLGYAEQSRLYPGRTMPPYEVLTGISLVVKDCAGNGGGKK